MKNLVSHTGKVVSVSDTHVFVKIERGSACSGCKNKGACQMGENQEQIIPIKTADTSNYFANEDVHIFMRTSLGMRAVVYAYLLPFVFLLVAFLVARLFTSSEIIQVLCAFVSVIVYYVILYKMRNGLEKTFQFYVEKCREKDFVSSFS